MTNFAYAYAGARPRLRFGDTAFRERFKRSFLAQMVSALSSESSEMCICLFAYHGAVCVYHEMD
jgi:hypothetical protein